MREKDEQLNKKLLFALKCLIVFLFPFCLCLCFCLLRNTDFFSLYFPNVGNNDCFFYYKITEGLVNFDMPLGYFGFDESHAMYGSLAAWSPVIFIPWVIWGKLFGFTYYSLIACNIACFSVALATFVFLSRIGWKEIICLLALLACFPSLSIHLLVGLPEAVIVSVLLVLIGAGIGIETSERKIPYVIIMLVMGIYLTLCRPYMIVFLLLPCFYLIKRKHFQGTVISILIVTVTLVTYFLIGRFFTADYFEPLFDLSLIKLIFQGHPIGALRKFISSVTTMIPGILKFCARAFTTGWVTGTQYVVFFVSIILIFISVFEKENEKKRPVLVTFLIAAGSLFVAIVFFLGKVNEGGRHVWGLAIVGLVLLSVCGFSLKGIIGKGLMGCLLLVFVLRWSPDSVDYDIPFPNEELEADISYWQSVFDNPKYELSEDIGYDNTLIWVLIDIKENQSVVTNYHELYALPAGMGISCCWADLVLDETDSLKSRYIATVSGGNLDTYCFEQGFSEVGRTEKLVIYARY